VLLDAIEGWKEFINAELAQQNEIQGRTLGGTAANDSNQFSDDFDVPENAPTLEEI
jgi:hypothetical protein